jgi:uncharacterized protein
MAEINWQGWTEKVFAEARQKKRPIVLDISAGWCHWCRVMDETTYSDPRVQEAISRDFIAVKVDSDRHPDINSRYNLGGWPTTAFLSPDGTLITGGTYMAPEEMLQLLPEVRLYQEQIEAGGPPTSFPEAGVYQAEPPPVGAPDQLSKEAIDYFADLAQEHFDAEHGGFGRYLKFPMPAALKLVTALAFENKGPFVEMLDKTLTKMARGPIFDGQEGGFFRYATAADWSDPHWEKLLIDQAEMALIYMDAFSLTANPLFADTADSTLSYVETVLRRPDGRFGASQEADETYYQLSADGRAQRPAPAVDNTVFSGWTARACSAFIKADAVLEREGAKDIALKSLNTLFGNFRDKSGLFRHYVDNGRAVGPGFLFNQAAVLSALIDAFEASGNVSFIKEAISLAAASRRLLTDKTTGAFLDRPADPRAIGALKLPNRPIDQNAAMAIALIRLSRITGDSKLEAAGRSALGAFAENYREYGLLASEYGLGVGWLISPALEIWLSGDKRAEERLRLWLTARVNYYPRKVIIPEHGRSIKQAPKAPEKLKQPAAYVCIGDRCLEPATDPDQLAERFTGAA